MRTSSRPYEQPRSGTYPRADSRMTRSGADRCSSDGTHRCPNCRTAHSLLRDGCLRTDACLMFSKLSANGVIGDKDFERFSRGGHHY